MTPAKTPANDTLLERTGSPADPAAGASSAAPATAPRRSLTLDIAGADLMLRGRFTVWESGLLLGPDLDHAGVRLAVDVTSASGVAQDEDAPLFSFRSRSVEPAGPGTFRADGVLTGARGPRALAVTVETPPGHTPLAVLSFAADREDFGEGWAELIRNTDPFKEGKDGEPVRLAHAWLTAPVLAAA
jgi:hypothetical protein